MLRIFSTNKDNYFLDLHAKINCQETRKLGVLLESFSDYGKAKKLILKVGYFSTTVDNLSFISFHL